MGYFSAVPVGGWRMKVGIHAAGLVAYGGGEKYVCKIAEILSKQHEVDLLTFAISEREVAPVLSTLENRLNVDLKNVHLRVLSTLSIMKRIPYTNTLMQSLVLSKCSREYDLFVNQPDVRFPQPAYANKNIVVIQAPVTNVKKPALFGYAGMKLFFDTNLSTYDKIVVYSNFVKKTVEKKYSRDVEVLYPPIDVAPRSVTSKERIILSVGRFFTGWHSKKQLEMIQTFKQLCNDAKLDEAGWEYHLVGGWWNVNGQQYGKMCEQEAKGYPIFFHFSAPFETVTDLYRRSALFWHATGFDEDENKYPEKMEHFGMATAEAMSAGCVPIVVRKGGQREIVHHDIDGMLWDTLDGLKEYTLQLINEPEKRERLASAAIETSRRFDTDQFEIKVKQLFI